MQQWRLDVDRPTFEASGHAAGPAVNSFDLRCRVEAGEADLLLGARLQTVRRRRVQLHPFGQGDGRVPDVRLAQAARLLAVVFCGTFTRYAQACRGARGLCFRLDLDRRGERQLPAAFQRRNARDAFERARPTTSLPVSVAVSGPSHEVGSVRNGVQDAGPAVRRARLRVPRRHPAMHAQPRD